MLEQSAMALACLAGVAVGLRLLIALRRDEHRNYWIGYLVRIHAGAGKGSIAEGRNADPSIIQAA